jgi:hypothetical protein
MGKVSEACDLTGGEQARTKKYCILFTATRTYYEHDRTE